MWAVVGCARERLGATFAHAPSTALRRSMVARAATSARVVAVLPARSSAAFVQGSGARARRRDRSGRRRRAPNLLVGAVPQETRVRRPQLAHLQPRDHVQLWRLRHRHAQLQPKRGADGVSERQGGKRPEAPVGLAQVVGRTLGLLSEYEGRGSEASPVGKLVARLVGTSCPSLASFTVNWLGCSV